MELQNTESPQGNEVNDFIVYTTATIGQKDAKDMIFADTADICESCHCKKMYIYSAKEVCRFRRKEFPDNSQERHSLHHLALFHVDG